MRHPASHDRVKSVRRHGGVQLDAHAFGSVRLSLELSGPPRARMVRERVEARGRNADRARNHDHQGDGDRSCRGGQRAHNEREAGPSALAGCVMELRGCCGRRRRCAGVRVVVCGDLRGDRVPDMIAGGRQSIRCRSAPARTVRLRARTSSWQRSHSARQRPRPTVLRDETGRARVHAVGAECNPSIL